MRHSQIEYPGRPSADTIQLAIAGYLGSRLPFKASARRNGTLVVTEEKVSFVPANRSGSVESMDFAEMSSLEIRSSFGRRTVTFRSPGRSLTVKCHTSKNELGSLYSYVHQQIAAFGAAAKPGARYLLTQLESGPHRYQAHNGEKQPHELAIQVLFGEGESESIPSRPSALAAIDQLDGLLMEQKKLDDARLGQKLSSQQDEVVMRTLFGEVPPSHASSSNHSGFPGTGRPRQEKLKGWRYLVPAVALLVAELWWVSGLSIGEAISAIRGTQELSTVERGRPQPLAVDWIAKDPFGYQQSMVSDTAPADIASGTLDAEDNQTVTRLLAEQREAAGLTQEAVARAIGRPPAFIAAIESGRRPVQLPELLEISKVIRLDIRDIREKLESAGSVEGASDVVTVGRDTRSQSGTE